MTKVTDSMPEFIAASLISVWNSQCRTLQFQMEQLITYLCNSQTSPNDAERLQIILESLRIMQKTASERAVSLKKLSNMVERQLVALEKESS